MVSIHENAVAIPGERLGSLEQFSQGMELTFAMDMCMRVLPVTNGYKNKRMEKYV